MKTCTRCGEDKPQEEYSRMKSGKDGRKAECKPCAKDRQKEWYNRPEVKDARIKYKEARKEEVREYGALYRSRPEVQKRSREIRAKYLEENRERTRAKQAEYRQIHSERVKANKAKYRSKDGVKEYEAAQYARYKASNPHVGWVNDYRHRARKFGFPIVEETFTKEDVIARYGDACLDCGGDFEQIDHVIPVRFGGTHTLDNCQPVCQSCNLARWHQYQREAYTLMSNIYTGEAA